MKTRSTLLALGTAAMLATGFGLVTAQANTAAQTPEIEMQANRIGKHKNRGGLGMRLALGTTAEYSFYDGDPEAGANLTSTLSFTQGTDSEAAFAETFKEARDNAAYMVVKTSEQSRTLELTEGIQTRRGGLRFLGHNLNRGSTLNVTFFDGDPEAGGQPLQSMTFTYGTDSEAGFAAELEAASENASYVTITTSPQERTIDLSARAEQGQRGPGRPGSRRN